MTNTSRGRPADLPTAAELEILRVLWERGPCTVGQVQQALQAAKPTGYTTALKLMQIMAEKRLLVRDERRRPHVYCSRVPAEETQRTLVRDLLDRAFAGAADQLVMRALGAKEVSAGELARIRELLDEMEGRHP
jgi:BlaI family transcriptional regulator, penicillinase repressor